MGDDKKQSVGSSLLAGLPVLGGIASSIANAVTSNAADTRSRHMYWDSYNRSRTDALSDWNMQNEYNSPVAQMERLKAAGLNPNLVYGNGATATSQSQPRQASGTSYQTSKPNIDLQQPFMGYIDAKYKQQVIDNLQVRQELDKQKTLTEMNKAIVEGVKADVSKYTKDNLESLSNLSVDVMKANLFRMISDTNRIQANTMFTLAENQRQELMNAPNVMQAYSKLVTMQLEQQRIKLENAKTDVERKEVQARIDLLNQQKANLSQDWFVKKLDAAFAQEGIRPNAPVTEKAVETIKAIFKRLF